MTFLCIKKNEYILYNCCFSPSERSKETIWDSMTNNMDSNDNSFFRQTWNPQDNSYLRFFLFTSCVAHNVLFCIMGSMSSELRIWSQKCVLCTKSLQLKLQVTRPLQKGAGNLYFQQTSKEPTSNCKGCIWELWSNSPACWSSEWWSSFPLCRSQSCKTSLGLLQQCRAHNETRISFFVE